MSKKLLSLLETKDILTERFDQFEWRLKKIFSKEDASSTAERIIEALESVPDRDKYIFEVEINSDTASISSIAQKNIIIEHIDSYFEDNEEIEFHIKIIKTTFREHLSIYCLTEFCNYLNMTSLEVVIEEIVRRFGNRLVFDCRSDSAPIGSPTLQFIHAGEAGTGQILPFPWRERSLELLQNNSHHAGGTTPLLPHDFGMLQKSGVDALDHFMDRANATLSVIFLANSTTLNGNSLDYKINGYKLLSGNIQNINTLIDESGQFRRIAEWACGAEGSSDKLGLARNVISLCTQNIEDVPGHPEIWQAIQSNYQIYLKENISTYLEVRNKMAELLAESTHKTHSLVESLLDSLRNGVLILLTFILTVVVVNGFKDTGIEVIFSGGYLFIIVSLIILVTFVVYASATDIEKRFEKSTNAISALLKRMYGHVMLESEISQQTVPTINENRDYLNDQICKYKKFWWIFSCLVISAFLIGFFCFGSSEKILSYIRDNLNKIYNLLYRYIAGCIS